MRIPKYSFSLLAFALTLVGCSSNYQWLDPTSSEPRLGIFVHQDFLGRDTRPSSPLKMGDSKSTLSKHPDSEDSGEGLLPSLFKGFEEQCKCRVDYSVKASTAGIASAIRADRSYGEYRAQVVLGIDQVSWAELEGLLVEWKKWRPFRYSQVDERFKLATDVLPVGVEVAGFALNPIALIGGTVPPKSLRSLSARNWAGKVLVPNPESSDSGRAFIAFVAAASGKHTNSFFKNFHRSNQAYVPDQEIGLALFRHGEGSLVWTGQHLDRNRRLSAGSSSVEARMRALEIGEGRLARVFGTALIEKSIQTGYQRALAREFLDYMVSPVVQKYIASRSRLESVTGEPDLGNVVIPKVESKKDLDEALAMWSESLK